MPWLQYGWRRKQIRQTVNDFRRDGTDWHLLSGLRWGCGGAHKYKICNHRVISRFLRHIWISIMQIENVWIYNRCTGAENEMHLIIQCGNSFCQMNTKQTWKYQQINVGSFLLKIPSKHSHAVVFTQHWDQTYPSIMWVCSLRGSLPNWMYLNLRFSNEVELCTSCDCGIISLPLIYIG